MVGTPRLQSNHGVVLRNLSSVLTVSMLETLRLIDATEVLLDQVEWLSSSSVAALAETHSRRGSLLPPEDLQFMPSPRAAGMYVPLCLFTTAVLLLEHAIA
jgi:hypothetical protein